MNNNRLTTMIVTVFLYFLSVIVLEMITLSSDFPGGGTCPSPDDPTPLTGTRGLHPRSRH